MASTRYTYIIPRGPVDKLICMLSESAAQEDMSERPLQCTAWVRMDPPGVRREFPTAADTNGELDWDKVTRLGWRPAWAIRSRHGALAPFLEMLRDLFRRKR